MMGIWYTSDESACKPWWGETKDYVSPPYSSHIRTHGSSRVALDVNPAFM